MFYFETVVTSGVFVAIDKNHYWWCKFRDTQKRAYIVISQLSIEILVIHIPLRCKDFSFNLLDFFTTRSLIQELADYEKMPNGPKISAQQLEEDGFGPHKYFHCKVAELEGEVHSYSDQTTIT